MVKIIKILFMCSKFDLSLKCIYLYTSVLLFKSKCIHIYLQHILKILAITTIAQSSITHDLTSLAEAAFFCIWTYFLGDGGPFLGICNDVTIIFIYILFFCSRKDYNETTLDRWLAIGKQIRNSVRVNPSMLYLWFLPLIQFFWVLVFIL